MVAPDGQRHCVVGRYRKIDSPKLLVFTWTWEQHEHGAVGTETLVTVEFHDRGGKTELVLTHTRLPGAQSRDQRAQGWNGCLSRLPENSGHLIARFARDPAGTAME